MANFEYQLDKNGKQKSRSARSDLKTCLKRDTRKRVHNKIRTQCDKWYPNSRNKWTTNHMRTNIHTHTQKNIPDGHGVGENDPGGLQSTHQTKTRWIAATHTNLRTSEVPKRTDRTGKHANILVNCTAGVSTQSNREVRLAIAFRIARLIKIFVLITIAAVAYGWAGYSS